MALLPPLLPCRLRVRGGEDGCRQGKTPVKGAERRRGVSREKWGDAVCGNDYLEKDPLFLGIFLLKIVLRSSSSAISCRIVLCMAFFPLLPTAEVVKQAKRIRGLKGLRRERERCGRVGFRLSARKEGRGGGDSGGKKRGGEKRKVEGPR